MLNHDIKITKARYQYLNQVVKVEKVGKAVESEKEVSERRCDGAVSSNVE